MNLESIRCGIVQGGMCEEAIMIISKKRAKRLIRIGKAREAGTTRDHENQNELYAIVDRLDKKRIDHYRL